MAYKAFISYSHAADGKLAPALQSALHRFAKPFYRLRALRVFRDKSSLQVTPQLWPVIQEALAGSEYFLLMASPEAAKSHWVQAEVAEWLRLRNGLADKLLLVVTDGEAVWDDAASDFDWELTTALPPTLRGVYEREPLYCDLRWARTTTDLSLRNPQFLDAVGSLGATLHGRSKDEMIGDDVRQHRLFKSMLTVVALLLLGLTVVAAGAAFYAVRQRDEARRQTLVAQSQRAEADLQRQSALESAERARRAADSERLAREDEQKQRREAEQATKNERAAKEQAEERRTEAEKQRSLADAQRQLADERRIEAERERNIAASRELASAALAQLPSDPELSLLLSLNAHDRTITPTAEAEESLRLSLLRSHVRDTFRGVNGLAASPDWRWIVVVRGRDGRALEPATGHSVQLELPTHYRHVPEVRFSRDGRLALMLFRDPDLKQSCVYVWEVDTWRRLPELPVEGYKFDARFSPDGRQVLVEGKEQSHVLDIASRKALALEGRRLVSGPDGEVLLSSGEGFVRARRAATGEALWEAECGTASSESHTPVFSPDSKYVALKCAEHTYTDGQAHVLEAATGRKLAAFPQKAFSWGVGFSPDGRWLVTTHGDNVVHVWEAGTWQRVAELREHAARVSTFAFSPGGEWLVTAGSDYRTLVWETGTWRNVDKLRGQAGSFLTFDAKGKVLVTSCTESAVCVWQVGSWQLITALQGHFSPVWGWGLMVSPEGRYVFTNHYDRSVRLWEVGTDEGVVEVAGYGWDRFGHAPPMMYSPDSRHLAIENRDGFVEVLEIETGRRVLLDRGEYLAFSPDGKYVFMKAAPYTVQIRDARTGLKVHELHGHTTLLPNRDDQLNDVEAVAFSPDGRWVVTAGGADSTARVWEMGTWRSAAVLRDPDFIEGAAFSPDSKWLITTGKVPRVWEVGPWRAVADLSGHEAPVKTAAFSRDGRRLVTSGSDDAARLWETDAWRCIAVLRGHTSTLVGAAFSPDSRQVLTWARDNTARLWDAETGAESAVLAGDPVPWRSDKRNKINSACFSPDGRLIAVASGQTVYVLGADRKRVVKILPVLVPGKDTDNSPRTVNGATFSPDGKFLLTATNHGVMRIYKWEMFAPFEEILKVARTRVTRKLTRDEREKYLHETAGKE